MILLYKKGDPTLCKNPEMGAMKINDTLRLLLDTPYKPLAGCLLKQHTDGPILWEQERWHQDEMYVESNMIATNVLSSHNNCALINGIDSGSTVEEYTATYMTKEEAPLRQAAAILLAAVDEIHKHPSTAEDSGSLQRNAKHLAQRTVNKFTGAHQWSMPLMVHALLGFSSYFTSETYRYVFGHENIAYLDNLSVPAVSKQETDTHVDSAEFVKSCLKTLEDLVDETNHDVPSGGGATLYKVNDDKIILTQAESYATRGSHFESFSQLEFECIIEILPKKEEKKDPKKAGRPSRKGFCLGNSHPLFNSHQGFARLKTKTAIFGGRPIPKFPGNRPEDESQLPLWIQEMSYFSKFIIDTLVPWQKEPLFPRNEQGLFALAHAWDRRSAPFICRQRYIMIYNIMCQGNRSSQNATTASLWRQRNADWWKNLPHKFTATTEMAHQPFGENYEGDAEASGRLMPTELFELTNAASTGIPSIKQSVNALRSMCLALHEPTTEEKSGFIFSQQNALTSPYLFTRPVVFQRDVDEESILGNQEQPLSLSDIRKQIYAMQPTTDDEEVKSGDALMDFAANGNGPKEQLIRAEYDGVAKIGPCFLTNDQYAVLANMLDKRGNKLVFMHGGGGTGKSTVICKLNDEVTSRGGTQCNTSPTGVAASQLPHGQTFHGRFKTHLKDLNAGNMITAMFDSLGGNKLKVVAIDKVSMLPSYFLTLLDTRLKTMYNPKLDFGGIAILLIGDFMQLPVAASGRDLYRVMYGSVSGDDAAARALFAKFKVIEMTIQLRAADCSDHCR